MLTLNKYSVQIHTVHSVDETKEKEFSKRKKNLSAMYENSEHIFKMAHDIPVLKGLHDAVVVCFSFHIEVKNS